MVQVAWKRSDSKIALSRRAASGTFMPAYVQNQDFIVTETNVSSSFWYVTFTRSKLPSSALGVEKTLTESSQSMIWATSSATPLGDASSSFSFHSQEGKKNAKLFDAQSAIPTSPVITPPSISEESNPSVTHGILMFIGWAIITPFGIITARYLKEKWGIWWFRFHSGLMGVLLTILTIAGFVIIHNHEGNNHFQMSKYQSTAAIHVVI
jgi:hypothetical protein